MPGEREAVAERTHTVEQVDEDIAILVSVIRDAQAQIVHLEARISDAKEELRDLLERRGSNWMDRQGYARLIPDTVRLTYDTEALDQLILKDPLRHGWLTEYRKETPVRSSVQVK